MINLAQRSHQKELMDRDDIPFEAMARTTGTPASTLKSRFAAALTRLREQLAHLGYQTEETLP